ncbi:hypothetical protein I204_00855 [Kwoniella mangroviensis CBS 8886]|uniref:uncharacterized protein n=1 Tax=Kwoniella mangroviensis CBS 8507 TaxID=1296122 RepID=UPI00080CE99F|nr:uncharacterized protein I203_05809 [Kwoniella mangroviensis CBS 8507]OCF65067.1 hypothetical protein I203_05809 [Kwoniella mangroviensis CBS 8507]OCF78911.1 hypothetical protein I204_00855 [Kwoniella mangroviensis CBS 8886]
MLFSPSSRNRLILLSTIIAASILLLYSQAEQASYVYGSVSHYVTSLSTPCLDSIQHQRQILLSSYAESLSGVTHVALLDAPWHHNSGDSAIWLGEVALLEALGIEIRYVCQHDDYSVPELEAALEDVPNSQTAILLHGGGNFGDIWGGHQKLRNRILTDQPNRKIRHFPQTFEFSLERPSDLLEESLKAYQSHPDVEIVARDSESLRLFEETFTGVQVRLTPDVALFIGFNQDSPFTPPIMRAPGSDMTILNLQGSFYTSFEQSSALQQVSSPFGWPILSLQSAAQYDVVVVARGDKEGGQNRQDADVWSGLSDYSVAIRDWGDEWGNIKRPVKANFGEIDNGAGHKTTFMDYWNQAALLRVQWAMSMISTGKLIISDRLHTDIMAILLGIGHVVIETGSLRKVERVSDTWLTSCIISEDTPGQPRLTDANTIFVHSENEAIRAAQRLLRWIEGGANWSHVHGN